MKIGLPREIKIGEGRVALMPVNVKDLVAAGHTIYVSADIGGPSGFGSDDYALAGAKLVPFNEVYTLSDLIVKVKEPQDAELKLMKDNQIIFSYLHLAAAPHIVDVFQKKNITAVAFETVELDNGSRPLLIPMSIVAGRLAVQVGMAYLRTNRGLLISDAKTVVVGAAGTVGSAAIDWLSGLRANIFAIDKNAAGLTWLKALYPRVSCVFPDELGNVIVGADLLILGVVIHGAITPKLITRQMIKSMQPGGVLVDVAIDQGGCSETSRPMTLADPVYLEEGILHYCVPNMPGSVPRSSTNLLAPVVFKYLKDLATHFDNNLKLLATITPALQKGVQVYQGKITNEALARSLNKEYCPLVLK